MISTACPALKNIVIDTIEVGQTCIEYLRRNNLDRAMLILLNVLPAMNMHPIPTPENVPRKKVDLHRHFIVCCKIL